jgi:hypothetical protein
MLPNAPRPAGLGTAGVYLQLIGGRQIADLAKTDNVH